MQTRLIQTAKAIYDAATWSGRNESGRTPFGDAVLILPDLAAEKTKGGILFADTTKESQSLAAETGLVVAVGEGAFKWSADRTRPFEGRKPVAGDRIDYERYAGQQILGVDGQIYRLMTDKCVIALITDQG